MKDFLRAITPGIVRRQIFRTRQQVSGWRYPRRGINTLIDPSVQFIGRKRMRIGSNVQIGEQTWLNLTGFEGSRDRIIIGANSVIGRRNLISSGDVVEIGSYCLTASNCAFLGADHDFSDPMIPFATTGNKQGASIVIEPNCWFGAGAAVIGNVRVGRGSVIGAGTIITADIPPFSVVVGNPARVIRRYSFSIKKWVPAKQFCDDATIPSLEDYLLHLEDKFPRINLPWLAVGRRMGHLN